MAYVCDRATWVGQALPTRHSHMSQVAAPPANAVAARSCLSRLQTRQQSSWSASCSYVPTRVRPERSCVRRKAAGADVADPEQDEEVQEGLSQDLLSLLAPRTKPTPLLTPQEVGEFPLSASWSLLYLLCGFMTDLYALCCRSWRVCMTVYIAELYSTTMPSTPVSCGALSQTQPL